MSTRTVRGDALIYGLAVLAGAALVFQIQPIAGKRLLPAFGGGAAVWTTCMFFFQAMLLAGYGYTHVLTTCLAPRRQVIVHASLLLVSVLFLPSIFSVGEYRSAGGDPAAHILLALLTTIAYPFVMLASTAPLIQKWSSVTHPARTPWHLYALSNAGALLALVTYPLLIEPRLSLQMQSLAWSVGYLAFVVALLLACRVLWRRQPDRATAPIPESLPAAAGRGPRPPFDNALSVLLSAAGVVILLAVTSEITQNIAPVPFLWILPLVGYLLTYIICFSGEAWYDRSIWGSFFVVAASSAIILHFFGTSFPIVPVVAAWLLILFCSCMVCHAELYRLRPEPRYLTGWYLLVALGGALGGAFVSLVAPWLFERHWEGLGAIYLVYLAFGVVILREAGANAPAPLQNAATAAHESVERWLLRLFGIGWLAGILLLPGVVVALNGLRAEYDVASLRNFYGLLNVRDIIDDGVAKRILVDGTTIHGFQLLEADGRSLPTSYYGADTGIAYVMENLERRAGGLRVGIIGLGTGTLAAYGEASDRFRFYELNPAVVDVARQHFSFLRDSAATIDVVLGDGRVSLEREMREEGSRNYDVLVVDAFNSDAIPVHLLTLEALQLYWEHLKPDGVLALHLTNNYLDLVPVAASLGAYLDKQVQLVTTPVDTGVTSAADWVLMLEDTEPISAAVGEGTAATAKSMAVAGDDRVWTDDYSNLLGTLKRQR